MKLYLLVQVNKSHKNHNIVIKFYSLNISFSQVEKRALEIWGSEEKLLEELERREEKRVITKQKTYQKKMKGI